MNEERKARTGADNSEEAELTPEESDQLLRHGVLETSDWNRAEMVVQENALEDEEIRLGEYAGSPENQAAARDASRTSA